MKNTILLFLAFTFSVQFANAQSDATKEETISWINIYGAKGAESGKSGGITRSRTDIYINEVNEMAIITTERWWLDLDDPKAWKENGKNFRKMYRISDIEFIMLQPVVEDEYNYDKGYYKVRLLLKDKEIYGSFFVFPDKEKANSLFKALKHLASFYETNIEFIDQVSLENKF